MSKNLDDVEVTAPLVKTVTVPVDVHRAFELFTERITDWWPLATHSVGGEAAASVSIDGRTGGQILERLADGSTSVWGTVTDWEVAALVAFTWHPGHDADQATRVEVRFTADGDDTRVELTHTGWERRDPDARARYDSGWAYVLGRYTEYAVA